LARYYWLKLQHDFFSSKRIKKIRRLAGGDTYTIIYLKMQLKAIVNDGYLTYSGLEPTFAEELALDIDEEPDDVSVTVNLLLSYGLMETSDNKNFVLPYAIENTGKNESSAERVKKFRERKKELLPDVTESNVTCNVTCNVEKEIEKEKDIDKSKRKKFTPPTLKEIEEYVKERNSPVDAKRFFEYYESGGWKDGKGQAVKNWKQKLITWEQHDSGRPVKKTFTASSATPSQKTVDDLDHLLESL